MARLLVELCSPSSVERMQMWSQTQWQVATKDLGELRQVLLLQESTRYLDETDKEPRQESELEYSSITLLFSISFSVLLTMLEACAVIAPIRPYLRCWAANERPEPIDSHSLRRVL
jgi:hypothetical protein